LRTRWTPLLIVILIVLPIVLPSLNAIGSEPLYVVFIWHYHQPWYYSVESDIFVLPWVRMHSVGNYYKMAHILLKYPDVKVTFTFSGSLLTQLLEYTYANKTDYRELLSRKLALGESLSLEEKFSILSIPDGFFDINWNRFVNVIPKYRELRDRAQEALRTYIGLPDDEMKKAVVSKFTDQDFIDIACLFNLFWIDPQVLRELYPDLYTVREGFLKSRDYSCNTSILKSILDTHREIMGRTLQVYRELIGRGQVELIPVPYSHPLSPILTAFGLGDDLEFHVNLSLKLFSEVFNYKPVGVWPAELGINEDVIRVFAGLGLQWTITDDTILYKSIPGLTVKSIAGVTYAERYLWRVKFGESTIHVLFRNSFLSNLVSFTYSNMPSRSAALDLVSKLKSIARESPGNIIVIALDGENPWEHYEEFGDIFLNELYNQLSEAQREGILRTITPRELIKIAGGKAGEMPLGKHRYLDLRDYDISDTPVSYFEDAYTQLPREDRDARIAEGSWAGGELTVWIGQRQENVAWMLLAKTRQDILEYLGVDSLRRAYEKNPEAVKYILMAEASDWFWWYGGDGGGVFPSNILFKEYLSIAYKSIGLKPPQYLEVLFNPEGTPVGSINIELPKPTDHVVDLDGKLVEPLWNTAMLVPVGLKYVREALVSVSSSHLMLGFRLRESNLQNIKIAIYMTNWWRSVSPYNPGYNSVLRDGSIPPMGLFYELLIYPDRGTLTVDVADGRGGWLELFKLRVALGDSIEAVVPWSLLSLSQGDYSYIFIVVYANGSIVERSDRLGLTHLIQVPRALVAVGARVVFELVDPEGDDDGAGGYKYPLNPVFRAGVFDLVRFRVLDTSDSLRFEAYFKSLGGNLWSGPNGFSMQYIHIYVKTAIAVTGRNDTFGLNVALANDSRWHIAILVAPGWGSDPVPGGERSAIYYYNGSIIVQDSLFRVYADPSTESIIVEISKKLLFDLENIDKWVYTVVVTSYDGYGPDRIRPFGVESQEWIVGVGAKYAQAVLFNVIPRVMDVLSPSASRQYEMLNTFEVKRETGIAKMAVISGVGKVAVAEPEVVTRTITVTTLLEIPTTITETMGIEVKRVDTLTLILALIVGLILGIISSIVLLRRSHAKP